VILFDKRGTGLSDRGVGLPTLEERMDDVRAVMDSVGSARAAVMGISEAGALCSMFAATYPERTSALILVGCFPRRLWAPDSPWGPKAEQREDHFAAMERGWGSLAWAVSDLERRAPSVAGDENFARWWSTYLRMSASPGAAVAAARMNNQIDIRPVLPSIRVPTLVIHRTDDRTIDVEAGRLIARSIPDAQFIELPGTDHLPFIGDQDAVVDAVQEFLTGIRPTAVSDRVLTTVLAIELVNPTATAARAGQLRWRQIEAAHVALVRDQIQRHRGKLVAAVSGGFLAMFDGPSRGVRCALAIMDESGSLGIELRAALHTGEYDQLDEQLGGMTLRIASWAMAQAEPDQVLVSNAVHDLVAGSGIEFQARHEREAPDDLGLWRLYAVVRGARPAAQSADEVQPSQAQPASSLTTRERDVALLIARGFTNRQIGEQLVITPATAERHVLNIFNKLGFHSRSQVAAWVVEQGLGSSTS
jgi:pimeloyl-ACP methyl ester carboxylesterase/DNA-binding NarL/FixJ family response regulator